MKVLVAGGAGYIGSHMCKRLHEAGHHPIVLDDLSTGHREAVQWGELIVGSIADEGLVSSILGEREIDVVMHFAACSIVGESVSDPYSYYANNVSATLNLLRAMRANGVCRFIFSSTAAVFGEPEEPRISETHPRHPINPYGKTKLAVEHMLEDAALAYGLNVVVLRYFNAAGADPSTCIGEMHQPETHLIPRLLRRAAGEASEVRIFGTDYLTPDGTCIRDYIHVNDLAEAHLLAMGWMERKVGFHQFNLGNGNGYSVAEVVAAVEDVLGRSLGIPKSDRRPGDPAVLVASAEKATTQLGWQPLRPGIKQIISDAWNWHQRPRFG
ncbi:MAG: UDP-glucose 4-epimerase GalE [Panacagrimonas sp.]